MKFLCNVHIWPIEAMYHSVPQIRPPFATLALVQNTGRAYINVGYDNFSRDYALPSS